jgi:CheY-like chemotaxis protein
MSMTLNFSPCVFVADDDEDDRFLIHKAFSQINPECRLYFLTDGSELLKALNKTSILPSLIVLDLNMPNLNGLETLMLIRRNSKYDSVPIAMLTTSSDTADRERAYELKVNEFITKPTDHTSLKVIASKLREQYLLGKCIDACGC